MKIRKAFTLIEVIIAITVFTIFIGFVMSAYLTFHRSQQQVASTRSMLLEGQAIFDHITDLMDEYNFYFDYYNTETEFGTDDSYTLETQELVLISLDGENAARVYWEEDEEELTGTLYFQEGEDEAVALNTISSSVSFMSFRVFPDKNPYDVENQSDSSFPHFQPNVQMKMTLSRPGTDEDNVIVDLQTTITSRFYQ